MAEMRRDVPLMYEPKRKNRWRFNFAAAGTGIESWMCQTSKRPTVNVEATEIPFMNTKQYVAGVGTWDTVEIQFIDVMGSHSTSHAVMEWINKCIQFESGRMAFAAEYMRDIELEMLAPNGSVIERWTLKNSWVMKADFGELDMSVAELANVTIELRYDYAILHQITGA